VTHLNSAAGEAEIAGDAERYGAGLLDVAGALRRATTWWALWRVALAAIGAYATEPARQDLDPNQLSLRRQVREHALVSAMDAV